MFQYFFLVQKFWWFYFSATGLQSLNLMLKISTFHEIIAESWFFWAYSYRLIMIPYMVNYVFMCWFSCTVFLKTISTIDKCRFRMAQSSSWKWYKFFSWLISRRLTMNSLELKNRFKTNQETCFDEHCRSSSGNCSSFLSLIWCCRSEIKKFEMNAVDRK